MFHHFLIGISDRLCGLEYWKLSAVDARVDSSEHGACSPGQGDMSI